MKKLTYLASLAILLTACKSDKKKEEPKTPPETPTAPVAAIDAAPAAPTATDTPNANPGINDRYKTPEGSKKAIGLFEEEGRGDYQKPDEIMKHLAVEPGSTLCEVGAGSGYFTPFFSKAVGPEGKVISEDVIDHFVEHLTAKVKEQKLENVEVILGEYTDTKIGEDKCDLIAVFDVYHHFEYPKPMLASLASNLKEGGKLFLPTRTLQDEDSILASAKSLYQKVKHLTEKAIPLPSVLAESASLKDLVDRGVIKITPRGSRFLWTARVWEVSEVA